MIVVDTNVIYAACMKGVLTPLAEAARLRERWAAPLLWRSEFRSALLKTLRSGLITLDDAQAVLKKAETLMFMSEHPVRGQKAFEFAAKSKASAYDCEYVVLADDFGTRLITTDEALIVHFPKIAIHLRDYVAEGIT